MGEVGGDTATLLGPTGDAVLKVWPISKHVNGHRSNGTQLLEAVG